MLSLLGAAPAGVLPRAVCTLVVGLGLRESTGATPGGGPPSGGAPITGPTHEELPARGRRGDARCAASSAAASAGPAGSGAGGDGAGAAVGDAAAQASACPETKEGCRATGSLPPRWFVAVGLAPAATATLPALPPGATDGGGAPTCAAQPMRLPRGPRALFQGSGASPPGKAATHGGGAVATPEACAYNAVQHPGTGTGRTAASGGIGLEG